MGRRPERCGTVAGRVPCCIVGEDHPPAVVRKLSVIRKLFVIGAGP